MCIYLSISFIIFRSQRSLTSEPWICRLSVLEPFESQPFFPCQIGRPRNWACFIFVAPSVRDVGRTPGIHDVRFVNDDAFRSGHSGVDCVYHAVRWTRTKSIGFGPYFQTCSSLRERNEGADKNSNYDSVDSGLCKVSCSNARICSSRSFWNWVWIRRRALRIGNSLCP